jgi:hypothetical protein
MNGTSFLCKLQLGIHWPKESFNTILQYQFADEYYVDEQINYKQNLEFVPATTTDEEVQLLHSGLMVAKLSRRGDLLSSNSLLISCIHLQDDPRSSPANVISPFISFP